jgi:hypothetical protein
MNSMRTATFVLGAGAIAALIAGATTAGRRPVGTPTIERARPVELQGAELAAEIARLQERLRPTTEPSTSRNLFRFNAPVRPTMDTPLVVPDALPPAPPAMRPPLTLVGLAEDTTDAGVVRTAIISGFGDIFLVKAGDRVGSRYRVAAVASDGADLIDDTDGATLHLSLK